MDQSATGDIGSPYDSDREGPIDSSTANHNASAAVLSNGNASEEENKFQSAISAWRST